MTVRRLLSVLSVCVIASATVAGAQPKKAGKAPPVAPPKTGGAASGSAGAGSSAAAGSNGEVVQMAEDAPPADMNGTDENPDAPHAKDAEATAITAVPTKTARPGYPIEQALRPITLPQNMSEVSLAPHFQASPFSESDTLRARYGITRQIQLGLTYAYGGIYDDPATVEHKAAFHPGKAVALDLTVLVRNWIGIRAGVPIYINPIAVSLQLGAPLQFTFGNKFALGGLDDLFNIRIHKFAPSLAYEQANAVGAANEMNHTAQSKGQLRVSAYAIYQYRPNTAILGRAGINFEDFSSGRSTAGPGATTFLRAGVGYTPRRYLDVGLTLGFDDLARAGSFSPQGFVSVRM